MDNSTNCCTKARRVLLHEFLQKYLRESAKLLYIFEREPNKYGGGKCILHIEGARFTGDYQFCAAAAKESAADNALKQLQGLCENELRVMLKMPLKTRFAAIDGIREEMKILKKLLKQYHRGCELMPNIGHIYNHLDNIETQLQETSRQSVDVVDGIAN